MKNDRWTSRSHQILEQAGGLKNYNRWLTSHFRPYFGKTILEIGSGQGALSKLLPAKSIIVLSDVCSDYLKKLKQIFTDPVIRLNIENDAPENYFEKFDTIFSSNVFEHIKDDQKAFRNCYKMLRGGGYLLLFIPARPEIYGKLDEQMGHYRRYTKKDLTQKAKNVGFKIIDLRYANLPGYFLWWGRGRLTASRSDSRHAKIFDKFVVPLLYLENFAHPPFGQSLILIAQKSGK